MSAATRKERRAYAEMIAPNSFPDTVRSYAELPVWLFRAMSKGRIGFKNANRFSLKLRRRKKR